MSKRASSPLIIQTRSKRRCQEGNKHASQSSTSSLSNSDEENAEAGNVQEVTNNLPCTSTSTIEVPSRDWQSDYNLPTCMLNMYESSRWTDMIIRCGDDSRQLKAHKLVLAARSPVFEAMLFGLCSEQKTVYDFPEDNIDIFDMMLRFMYQDDVDLRHTEDAIKLMEMADMYQVNTLVAHCATYLEENIDVINVCRSLDLALKYDITDLRDKCCYYIDRNPTSVLRTKEFLSLSLEGLSYILKGDTLYVNEDFVFWRVEAWATLKLSKLGKEVSGKNIRELLGDAFYENRLTTLNTEAMMKCIKGKGYFSVSEYEDIIDFNSSQISELSFISNEKRVPLQDSLTLSCHGKEKTYKKISQSFDLIVRKDISLETITIPHFPLLVKISEGKLGVVRNGYFTGQSVSNKHQLPNDLENELCVKVIINKAGIARQYKIRQHLAPIPVTLKFPSCIQLKKEQSPLKFTIEIRPVSKNGAMRINCTRGRIHQCVPTDTKTLSVLPIADGMFGLNKIEYRNCSNRDNDNNST